MRNIVRLNRALSKIESFEMSAGDIRWKLTPEDPRLGREIAIWLRSMGVKTHIDLACGSGEVLKACLRVGIDSYGIEPRGVEHKIKGRQRIFTGTFSTFLDLIDKNPLLKVDAITITNTLHGKHYTKKEINRIIDMLADTAKIIVITLPRWDLINTTRLDTRLREFEFLKKFDRSHSHRTTQHYGFARKN